MNNLLKTILIAIAIGLQIGCSNLAEENQDSYEDVFYRIERLSLSQPEKALATLDSVERVGLLKPYDINFLRCLTYHNGYSDYHKALRYGLAAYNMPDAPRDAETRLRLIDLIADEYLNNGDYTLSVRFCTEGLRLAQDSLVKDMKANLHITLGLNLLEIGNEEDAFRHFRSGIGILASLSQESGSYNVTDDYIYAIGMTVNSLIEAGHYDEAASLMDEYLTAVDRLDKLPDTMDGLVDCRRSSGYAVLAYIHSKKGESDKAKKYYDLYCGTDYSSAPEGEQIRIPYLLASHRFEEALHYIKREKELWHESADTVSHAYIEEHLKHERDAYEGLGDFRSANRVAHIIETVSDSLRIRERAAEALELAEIYRTNEQAVQLEHQAYSIKIRNIAIVFSLIVIALAVAFILRILRQKRIITRKNRSMFATIDELMAFKDEMFETQSEIIRLRDMLKQNEQNDGSKADNSGADIHVVANEPEDYGTNKPEEKTVAAAGLSDRDRDLWERMNHDIIGQKLYLDPELSKNWLIKNYRIPVNKFAQLFKGFAGCTFSQYIQNCRLDHAVRLMRQHPQYNLESIAKESQMSKTTFYSRFQAKYGMSPSEFKDRDKDGSDAKEVNK